MRGGGILFLLHLHSVAGLWPACKKSFLRRLGGLGCIPHTEVVVREQISAQTLSSPNHLVAMEALLAPAFNRQRQVSSRSGPEVKMIPSWFISVKVT